jgi:hypothetical protein
VHGEGGVTVAAAVTRYALSPPSVADFRDAVARVDHGDPAVWARLCAEAGSAPQASTLTLAELDRLALVIRDQPGVLGVLGRSLTVRLTTCFTLTMLNGSRP